MNDILSHVSLHACLKMRNDADQVTIETELRLLLLTCCDADFRHNRHHVQTKTEAKRPDHVTPKFVNYTFNIVVKLI